MGGLLNFTKPSLGFSENLFGEVHAPHQIPKARVVAHVVEPGIDLQQCHPFAALLVASFQPLKASLRG